jgi:hypothetical protein
MSEIENKTGLGWEAEQDMRGDGAPLLSWAVVDGERQIASNLDRAEARLIAHAAETAAQRDRLLEVNKELVEALEATRSELIGLAWDENGSVIERISAALAKARSV